MLVKCQKCGSEWKNNLNRLALMTVCPFCQEQIIQEKIECWQFFDNTKDLLAFISSEYGNDALFGRKYLSDHRASLMPVSQKNLIKQAYECGAVQVIQNNMNSDQNRKETAVKQAVGKMIDTYASAKDAAERVVWEFTNAIGWGMPEPELKIFMTTSTPIEPVNSPLNGNPEAGKLMLRAWQFAEDQDWSDASEYFNKVLLSNPTYSPAFLGLLCVDLKVTKEANLANIIDPESITNHKQFKRVIVDQAIKLRMDGYIQAIKERIDKERKDAASKAERKVIFAVDASLRRSVQNDFDKACNIMENAQSPDNYRKAILAFSTIDTSNHDISSQVKTKIFECELIIQQMVSEIENVLSPLREDFNRNSKDEKQTIMQEQRKADLERINEENAKGNSDINAEILRIQQKFKSDYRKWQDECLRLKTEYNLELRKWELKSVAIKVQADTRKSQGLCQHCGSHIKGLFKKKCTNCLKSPNEPLKMPSPPVQTHYPREPRKPNLPSFTPKVLDESRYIHINSLTTLIAGIEWRILDKQGDKLLLLSEKVLEKLPYNVESKDITWENSTLRKHLNNDFYNKLGVVKHAIAETHNDNLSNVWYGTNGGTATTDRIFLLSLEEVDKYFGNSGDYKDKRRKKWSKTKFSSAIDGYHMSNSYNQLRFAEDSSKVASRWWLRSPGFYSHSAAEVDSDGGVCIDGRPVDWVDGGIRPAMWLNLQYNKSIQDVDDI